ncbi:hypothetical protein AMAG_00817 [Allomyces macrogynus ATCC 38327]|uniref:NADH dehydrogenase [ubiquinone] iron-sulfur protein 5 n=1 Tax=Allomyces macrogynus (strain ATCC 38327) TaxID=578462 RepID=A0A0L0RXL6_ALLM3|nr:hypothetical protein AMAG_00817 [Allomyces macrogynus ATCC 38327]|eukprot:KNE54869.1 hypothetical protein AMAG_00817 [Allomyces macrogynus ATCC 38327]
MASGFSLTGGRPRCYAFWQDVQKCFLTADEPRTQCAPFKADYFECLHHTKELARASIIAHQANVVRAQELAEQARLEKEGKSLAVGAVLSRGTPTEEAAAA